MNEKMFIIELRTGEYSDRRDVPMFAVFDESDAQFHLKLVQPSRNRVAKEIATTIVATLVSSTKEKPMAFPIRERRFLTTQSTSGPADQFNMNQNNTEEKQESPTPKSEPAKQPLLFQRGEGIVILDDDGYTD